MLLNKCFQHLQNIYVDLDQGRSMKVKVNEKRTCFGTDLTQHFHIRYSVVSQR